MLSPTSKEENVRPSDTQNSGTRGSAEMDKSGFINTTMFIARPSPKNFEIRMKDRLHNYASNINSQIIHETDGEGGTCANSPQPGRHRRNQERANNQM